MKPVSLLKELSVVLLLILASCATTLDETKAPDARVMLQNGLELYGQGEVVESLAAFDEIDEKYGNSTSVSVQEVVVEALASKALPYGNMGQRMEVIDIADEIDKRFSKFSSPKIQGQIARALRNKASTLEEMGNVSESIAVADEIIKRFTKDDQDETAVWVARSLYENGVRWGKEDNADNAFDEVDRRFGKRDHPATREWVCMSFLEKGRLLFRRSQKMEQTLTILTDTAERFESAKDSGTRACVLKIAIERARILKEKHKDMALLVLDEMIDKYKDDDSILVKRWVINALFGKADVYYFHQYNQKTLSIYQEIDRDYGQLDYPSLRELVARSLHNQARMNVLMGKRLDAIKAYDELIRRYSGNDSSIIRPLVASSIFYKVLIYFDGVDNDRDKKEFYDALAISTCRQLVNQFDGDKNEQTRLFLVRAYECIVDDLRQKERYDEIIELIDKAVQIYGKDGGNTSVVIHRIQRKRDCLVNNKGSEESLCRW
ncbi:MAG: hypothetical protein LBI92_07720 [Azoarcus sp.]|nr:hypothetical protein [Azoarcus sp.]